MPLEPSTSNNQKKYPDTYCIIQRLSCGSQQRDFSRIDPIFPAKSSAISKLVFCPKSGPSFEAMPLFLPVMHVQMVPPKTLGQQQVDFLIFCEHKQDDNY
jgi:hypothetical protein